MPVLVHDPNNRWVVAEVHVLSRDKRNVKRVGTHFFPDPTGTGPFLVIAPRQHPGWTLCKRTVVPEAISLNNKDGARQELRRKKDPPSTSNQRTKRVVCTPVGTDGTQSGSLETKAPAPRNQCPSLETIHRGNADIRKVRGPSMTLLWMSGSLGLRRTPRSMMKLISHIVSGTPNHPATFVLWLSKMDKRMSPRSWKLPWFRKCIFRISSSAEEIGSHSQTSVNVPNLRTARASGHLPEGVGAEYVRVHCSPPV